MLKKKKQKKHSYEDRLRYMHMLDEGYSGTYISKRYGFCDRMLKTLYAKYLEYGDEAVRKGKNCKLSFDLKTKIVLEVEKKHISLYEASLKYGPSISTIQSWMHKYRKSGLGALIIDKNRGGPPGMGRPRKDSKPLTELERLRKENQELKTDIALIKKLNALVEEREARLRKIGQGPSKN